ncbi:MAG: cell division protein ZapB [candidate division Zixibacteria bacterium]|nr:cell division protein ZapB [candidate division Zixibacteria bacterium]
MSDRFSTLEEKVNRVLRLVARLQKEKGELERENKTLTGELADLKRRYQELNVTSREQSQAVKSRLATVLTRIEELERLNS